MLPTTCVPGSPPKRMTNGVVGDTSNPAEPASPARTPLTDSSASQQDVSWTPVYGERSRVRDNYNQLDVIIQQYEQKRFKVKLEFRCYNSGVAIRYSILAGDIEQPINIEAENTKFRFPQDHRAWCTTTAQGEYEALAISRLPAGTERPLTIEAADDLYLALGEANLVDFARMKFERASDDSLCIISRMDGPVQADGLTCYRAAVAKNAALEDVALRDRLSVKVRSFLDLARDRLRQSTVLN